MLTTEKDTKIFCIIQRSQFYLKTFGVLCRHRAINLFMKCYKRQWLSREEPGHGMLIEDITVSTI